MNEEEKLTILIRATGRYSEKEVRRKVKRLLKAKRKVQYLADNLMIISVLVSLLVLVSYLSAKLGLT